MLEILLRLRVAQALIYVNKFVRKRPVFSGIIFCMMFSIVNPSFLVSNTAAYIFLRTLPTGSAKDSMVYIIAESGSTMFMGFSMRSSSDSVIGAMLTLGIPRYVKKYGYTLELSESMSYSLLENVKHGRFVGENVLINLNNGLCKFWTLFDGTHALNQQSIEYLTFAYKRYMTDHQKRLARARMRERFLTIGYFAEEVERYRDDDVEYWRIQRANRQAR